jgi:hypothetical protein
MGRRLGAFTVVLAAAALVVGVVSPATGSSGGGKDRTFRVVGVVTELNLVDVAPTGASLGDEIVFSEKLLRGGSQVGHEGAVCTTVSVERTEAHCVATFWFPEGQISGEGLVTLGSTAPYDVPITGGSGKYAGVEGELHVQPVSDTQGIQTFHLQH